MKTNKFGSIVNISSIDALSGDDKPQEAYGASKAALNNLAESLYFDFGRHNVRVSLISPGFIKTAMTDKIEEKSDRNGTKVNNNKKIAAIKCLGLNFSLIKKPKINAPNKLTQAALV